MNQYPRDEFDAVPERSQREGVHRSFLSVRDPRRGVWIIVVFGVLALIVGVCMYIFVRPMAIAANETEEDPASSSAAASSAPASAASSSAASSSAATSAASSAPSSAVSSAPSSSAPSSSASSTQESSEAASSSASDSASADTSLSVGVYNGTKVSGLANGSASSLRDEGFSSVTTGNWTKSAASSAVYYRSADSEATAHRIASRLGISTVYMTSNIPVEISVVIGADH